LQLQRDATAGGAVKAWPLVVIAWCLVLACASHAVPTSAPTHERAPVMPQDPHAEIERLSSEIERARGTMELPPPAVPAMATSAEPMANVPLSTSCTHGTSQKCTDSCQLSDSICTNADKICKLASQLAGDTWAGGKCDRAKATCDDASKQCCSCQP
jgi:hypothetical protein